MQKDIKLLIIDYSLSNLFSVVRACETLGFSPIITHDKNEIPSADAIILPGVGAFKEAMKNLRNCGLVEPLQEFVGAGKPFMGICLGLQLLFERSEEFGNTPGLGMVKGSIEKFPANRQNNIKVPQIAWNKIERLTEKRWNSSPLKTLSNGTFMYFVHSFYATAAEEQDVLTYTTYGETRYCSSVLKGNLFATQFHPEKSGAKGLSIYQNWLESIHKK